MRSPSSRLQIYSQHGMLRLHRIPRAMRWSSMPTRPLLESASSWQLVTIPMPPTASSPSLLQTTVMVLRSRRRIVPLPAARLRRHRVDCDRLRAGRGAGFKTGQCATLHTTGTSPWIPNLLISQTTRMLLLLLLPLQLGQPQRRKTAGASTSTSPGASQHVVAWYMHMVLTCTRQLATARCGAGSHGADRLAS